MNKRDKTRQRDELKKVIARENEILIRDETVRVFVEEGFLRRNGTAEIVDEVADDAEVGRGTSIDEKQTKKPQH